MSGQAQFQNVFRLAKPDNVNGGQPRVSKRNRQSVSCLPCRSRKLKCDRQTPCSSCVKRKDTALCHYANGTAPSRSRREGLSEAQLRLQKLEKLVSNLVQPSNHGPSNGSGEAHPNGGIQDSLEDLSIAHVDGHRPSRNTAETLHNFQGATHWLSVLDDIRDIQNILDEEPESTDEAFPPTVSAATNAFSVVFNRANPSLTLSDVLASLPPRGVVEELLANFFTSKNLQVPIIHKQKFMRQFKAFWENPSSASFSWISVLFSVLHIGSRISNLDGNETDYSLGELVKPVFLTRAGQALAVSQYHKGQDYALEAVVLIAVDKFMSREDPDSDAWLIMGFAARLAMKFGYHCDPSHIPSLSPFEGEMRRRTFLIVASFDLLLSFQAGLPTIIHEGDYDTALPRNLLDSDFDEDCEVLPPSRPDTDPTPMLYYAFKSRLGKILRRIVPNALTHRPRSYEETMKIDEELHQTYEGGPSSLKMSSFREAMDLDAFILLGQLNTSIIYHKCLCILHRVYITYGRDNPAFDYSRKTCLDAALQILSYQAEIHFACQPGGKFYGNNWMVSSLSLHDFLLAAMITCVDLYEYHKTGIQGAELFKTQVQRYDALRLSRDIWVSRNMSCRDSRQAASVLSYVLSKVPRPEVLDSPPLSTTDELAPAPQSTVTGGDDMNTSLPGSDAPLWITGLVDPNFTMDSATFSDTSPADLDTMFVDSNTIDWTLLDQYVYGKPLDPDSTADFQLPFNLSVLSET